MPKFKENSEVQRVSDPSQIGTVVEVREEHAGIQWYRVNLGGGRRPVVSENDLRIYDPGDSPADNLRKQNFGGYEEFQRLITFQRLRRDQPLRNNIYAFNASRTRFYPYQFKPLLKFLDSPKNRLLIADEVGLGKTIEACLIMTELRARQDLERVLVVCPANLRDKWQMELKKRFGEDFQKFRAKDFREFLDQYQEDSSSKLQAVVSLESIRYRPVLEKIEDILPALDLVIVDEAHHLRNFGTLSRRAGVVLGQIAGAMIFLTATPIHLGNENLYSLLNLLDEEEFPDLDTAQLRFKDNVPIVRAQICLGQMPPNISDAREFINQSRESTWLSGNPLIEEVEDRLNYLEDAPTAEPEFRRQLVEAQRDLAEINLMGHVFTRTRKREAHTTMAARRAHPLRVTLTETEREFYEAVTEFVKSEASRRGVSAATQWILQMPQRRVASSIPAMIEFYRDKMAFGRSEIDEDLTRVAEGDSFREEDVIEPRERLRLVVAKWPAGTPDSKYQAFVETLRGLREQDGSIKALTFSFFKGTLRYLATRLQKDGFSCRVIHGDVPQADRIRVIEAFRKDASIEILLSSRVGSEGLDFQFCNTLFNYDLPWNPMEVEQRIGRLDRIGQDAEVIRIYNFWIEDTIEARILKRLYDRIGIFRDSIGELETILGEEIGNLEIDLLSARLSEEEQLQRLDESLQAIEKRKADLKQLEKQAAKFVGTDLFFDDEVKAIRERRRYVTGEQVRRFLVDFIRQNCPKTHLEYDRQKSIGTIHPDDEFRRLVQQHAEPGAISRFLAAGKKGVRLTFDAETAFEQPSLEFVNILHPITQSIVEHYAGTGQLDRANVHWVQLKTSRMEAGTYFYFVFVVQLSAARAQNTLEMVVLKTDNMETACLDSDAEALLGEMVECGQSAGAGVPTLEGSLDQAIAQGTRIFLDRLTRIEEEASRHNDLFLERRIRSIETHFNKLINSCQERLDKAVREDKHPNYLRLLRGTMRKKEAERAQQVAVWRAKETVSIEHNEVAAGILEVLPPGKENGI